MRDFSDYGQDLPCSEGAHCPGARWCLSLSVSMSNRCTCLEERWQLKPFPDVDDIPFLDISSCFKFPCVRRLSLPRIFSLINIKV
ncbi:uncharacterized protein LACBIDRAFT_303905 [Laccaria bicolor S238N-H82]|uniref:Predicted protein n=1 Tax=Laccaria bicolor (strain S238N-H82 / ATCC MYA-4686) TaxID=486041 RepID=B0DKM4_LACBS|nr:uncharacterized protein LACBIDRAFT_303905 [Laccaria bicolor S238N-H82]EDR05090.1 predicted protein [Laccaria bicolor S238N-H82]|eukprot:XP_001884480.1 predicted protein [Laccaria bicolor S238N-H82]